MDHGGRESHPEHDESGLPGLRAELDGIDAQLLVLLNRRAEVSLQIGEWKKQRGQPVFSPGQEKQVLERLREKNNGPLNALQLQIIYEAIFIVSKELQHGM